MMPAIPCLKWYLGTIDNPKIRLAARHADVPAVTVIALFIALLEDASHPHHRGVTRKQRDYFAVALDMPDETDIEKALVGLEYVGWITVDGDEIRITDWEIYQEEQAVKDSAALEDQT